jgi:hypothetical protein
MSSVGGHSSLKTHPSRNPSTRQGFSGRRSTSPPSPLKQAMSR